MAAKVKALQEWCRRQCDGYRDVNITNMTSSWKSGLAFCAIIHRYRPDMIDYDSLRKENVFENNQLAFDTAQELGIPALLDAEDMVAMRVPDKLCIVTYVSQYHNYFRNKPVAGGPGVKKAGASGIKRAQSAPPPGQPETKKSSIENVNRKQQDKENAESYSGGGRHGSIGEICHLCHKKVYLMERHIDENRRLYHRKCIRETQRADSMKRNKHLSSITEDHLRDLENKEKGTNLNVKIPTNTETKPVPNRTKPSPPAALLASTLTPENKSVQLPSRSPPRPSSLAMGEDSSVNLSKSLYGASAYKSPTSPTSSSTPLATSTPTAKKPEIRKKIPIQPINLNGNGFLSQLISPSANEPSPTSPTQSKVDEMKMKWLSEQEAKKRENDTKSFEDRASTTKSPISPSGTWAAGKKSEDSVLSGLLSTLSDVRKNGHSITSSPDSSSHSHLSTSRSILKRGSDEGLTDSGHESQILAPRPILKNKNETTMNSNTPVSGQSVRSILKTSSETPFSSEEIKPALKHSPETSTSPASPKSVLKASSESLDKNLSTSPPKSALKHKPQSVLTPNKTILKSTTNRETVSSSHPKPILKTKDNEKQEEKAWQIKEPKPILRKNTSDENPGSASFSKSSKNVASKSGSGAMDSASHFQNGEPSKESSVTNNMSAFNLIDSIDLLNSKQRPQSQMSWKLDLDARLGKPLSDGKSEKANKDTKESKEKSAFPSGHTGVSQMKEYKPNSEPERFSKLASGDNKPVRVAKIVVVESSNNGPQINAAAAKPVQNNSEESKPAWQIEAEKRAATRKGKYVDPEKNPSYHRQSKQNTSASPLKSSGGSEGLDMVSIVQKQLKKGPKSTTGPVTANTKPNYNADSPTRNSHGSPGKEVSTTPNRVKSSGQVKDTVAADSSKPEWMLEAERRQEARKGNYADPEKRRVISAEPITKQSNSPEIVKPKKKIVPNAVFNFGSGESDLESSLEMSPAKTPNRPSQSQRWGPQGKSTPPREPFYKNGHPAFSGIQNRPLPPTPGTVTQKRKVNAEARMSTWQIQRTLIDLDKKLQVMEAQGRELEESIRSGGILDKPRGKSVIRIGTDEAMDEDADELMIKWFELVNQKNELVRQESDLMYRQKQQELEDMHADVEYDLRCLMEKPDHLKTASDKIREESLLQQLLDTVSLRNNIVDSMEEDRIRYIEEDEEIAGIIAKKDFCAKPEPEDLSKTDKKRIKEEKKKKEKESKQKEKEQKKKDKTNKKDKKKEKSEKSE